MYTSLPYSLNAHRPWTGQEQGRYPGRLSTGQFPLGEKIGPLTQGIIRRGTQAIANDVTGGGSKYNKVDVSKGVTNIPITLQFNIDYKRRILEYCCLKTYCFIERTKLNLHTTAVIQPEQFIINVSTFNRLLEPGGTLFNRYLDKKTGVAIKTAQPIMKDFAPLGNLKYEPTGTIDFKGKTSLVEPYEVAGESYYYNDWVALEGNGNINGIDPLEEGQSLFYVLRRVKRTDPMPFNKQKLENQKNKKRKCMDLEIDYMNKIFPFEKILNPQAEPVQEQSKNPDIYYWRFETRKGVHGQREPPFFDWNSETRDVNDDDFFVGRPIYVGFVTRFHGRMGKNPQAPSLAYQSLFPSMLEEAGSYKEKKTRLPELGHSIHPYLRFCHIALQSIYKCLKLLSCL